MTITNLANISESELEKLLADCNINIKKKESNRFVLVCPGCEKPDAYIYVNGTVIECNRQNKCGYKQKLWDVIAERQGKNSNNKTSILGYINTTLGYEFKEFKTQDNYNYNPSSTVKLNVENKNPIEEEKNYEPKKSNEELRQAQKFFKDCSEIFSNFLHCTINDERVEKVWQYLTKRGCKRDESIKEFGLGFFPNRQELYNILSDKTYCYNQEEANALIDKYFIGVLKANNYHKLEEDKYRIVFTWYSRNENEDIDGFSIRRLSNIQFKYLNNNEMRKTEALFNLPPLGLSQKEVIIVEGVMDAITGTYFASQHEDTKQYHFVATGGNKINSKQVALLEKSGYARAIILPDNDEAGNGLIDSITKIKRPNIEFFKASIPAEYQVKDIAEFIENHRESVNLSAMFENAMPININSEQNASISRENTKMNDSSQESEITAEDTARREEYLKNNVANRLEKFKENINKSTGKGFIPTGFDLLDNILDGGLFDGLYVIGAISSLGKTTFVIQIADYIASCGRDVLYFSLEMSSDEIMAKSISRHTMIRCKKEKDFPIKAKSVREITGKYTSYEAEERELIDHSIKEYEKYADKLYIIEGLGEIGVEQVRKFLETHILYTQNIPIVIIDYLQILSPYNAKATDKQNTDKSVLELKRISRDFKIPVIAISSLNRQSYKDAITMEAFKESGAIEYSSDVLIGLQLENAGGNQFDVDAAKSANPRKIELKILKNRNGVTGETRKFDYHPKHNYFFEPEENSILL